MYICFWEKLNLKQRKSLFVYVFLGDFQFERATRAIHTSKHYRIVHKYAICDTPIVYNLSVYTVQIANLSWQTAFH